MRIAELADKHVAIWGYGREGRAVMNALCQRLPRQNLNLLCSAQEAAHAQATYGDAIICVTGEPDFNTLSRFDVIVKSPGISAYNPALLEAQKTGTHVTSGSALWFAEHPEARVIAVTGTKGKSTTAALIAHLLRRLGRRVALAGNIGLPLLDLLNPPIKPDWWVVELSSFQTCDEAVQPDIAVILNLYEEHIDWHGSASQYYSDKLRILKNEQRTFAVLNASDDTLSSLRSSHRKLHFNNVDGWQIANNAICHADKHILDFSVLPLPGKHNALNVCAALTALEAGDEDAHAAIPHISTFKPLPHRLQPLGERDGFLWINDSIATTPAATWEALHSLSGRQVTVLIGGFERGISWLAFAQRVQTSPPYAIVTMGANGPRLASELEVINPSLRLQCQSTLAEAVSAARAITPLNGVILLSPGAPSFDQFHDYAERGRMFTSLAGFDPNSIANIEGLGIS